VSAPYLAGVRDPGAWTTPDGMAGSASANSWRASLLRVCRCVIHSRSEARVLSPS
jgi:hypothetical protein